MTLCCISVSRNKVIAFIISPIISLIGHRRYWPDKTILVNPIPTANEQVPRKHAKLIIDSSADGNVISYRIFTKLLHQDLSVREQSRRSVVHALGSRFKVLGVFTMEWSLQTAPDDIFTMECYVVDDDTSCFDVVVGKGYMEKNPVLQPYVWNNREFRDIRAQQDSQREPLASYGT
jgi:hypothetical protein